MNTKNHSKLFFLTAVIGMSIVSCKSECEKLVDHVAKLQDEKLSPDDTVKGVEECKAEYSKPVKSCILGAKTMGEMKFCYKVMMGSRNIKFPK